MSDKTSRRIMPRSLAVGAVALGRRQPTIYTPHAYAFLSAGDKQARQLAYRLVEGVVVRRCDLLGAVSEAEAELGRQKLAAPRVTVNLRGTKDNKGAVGSRVEAHVGCMRSATVVMATTAQPPDPRSFDRVARDGPVVRARFRSYGHREARVTWTCSPRPSSRRARLRGRD